MYEELISWFRKHSDLLGASCSVSRINRLLNDPDLGLYDSDLIFDLASCSEIWVFELVVGCKATMSPKLLLDYQEALELVTYAGIDCKVIDDSGKVEYEQKSYPE